VKKEKLTTPVDDYDYSHDGDNDSSETPDGLIAHMTREYVVGVMCGSFSKKTINSMTDIARSL
jgi:hypothetical protein